MTTASPDRVAAWETVVTIPTYQVGPPDKNPMFLEKRVYQGSSGVVYPHPIIERVFDEKTDQNYTAVYLENRYLKIMLLPELGGRVQMALDKTNGYHFVYYNSVIKPALVGLTGPWISGGIEFNWPQHHRAQHLRAGRLHPRRKPGRQLDRLVQRDRAHVPHERYGRLHALPRPRLSRTQRTVVQPDQRAADLPLVGEPRRARQRRLPVRFSARRARRDGSWQARRVVVSHRDRHLLQDELRAGDRHFTLQEYPGPDLVHGLSLGFRLSRLLRSRFKTPV